MKNIFNNIKFLFRKKGEFFVSIKEITGLSPIDITYYQQAITHRSASVRDTKGRRSDNERLEFLGDAVIETIISDILYRKYPNRDEGFLSTMRSKLVERKNLGRIAQEIGLIKLLRTDLKQHIGKVHHSYLGGNAFEALVGAIYLDHGFKGAFRFINHLIEHGNINIAKTARIEENFKSLLLEWGQKYKVDVKFVLQEEKITNRGNKQFRYAVMIEGREVAIATGLTKKDCHQLAAKKTLHAFQRNPNFEYSVRQMKLIRQVIEDMLPYAQPTTIICSQQSSA